MKTKFQRRRENEYLKYTTCAKNRFFQLTLPFVKDVATMIYGYYEISEVEHFEQVILTNGVRGECPAGALTLCPQVAAIFYSMYVFDSPLRHPSMMMRHYDSDGLIAPICMHEHLLFKKPAGGGYSDILTYSYGKEITAGFHESYPEAASIVLVRIYSE